MSRNDFNPRSPTLTPLLARAAASAFRGLSQENAAQFLRGFPVARSPGGPHFLDFGAKRNKAFFFLHPVSFPASDPCRLSDAAKDGYHCNKKSAAALPRPAWLPTPRFPPRSDLSWSGEVGAFTPIVPYLAPTIFLHSSETKMPCRLLPKTMRIGETGGNVDQSTFTPLEVGGRGVSPTPPHALSALRGRRWPGACDGPRRR